MRIGSTFLFFLLCLQWVRAQPGENNLNFPDREGYDIKQYNSENGLPQNSASDLFLDQNHFCWIATQNGMVRFDGQRFRIYNSTNTPALKVNRFSVISATGRQLLFSSSFDAPEIYTVTPDYKILLDSVATALPHKLISNHSNGIFDCSALFSFYAKNKDPFIDTVFLNKLCHSDIYSVLNEREAMIWYRSEWYYLNNSVARITKLPIQQEHWESPPEFFIGNVFCTIRKNGEILAFKEGKPVDIKVDSTASSLVKGAASLPTTQFFIYTKGDQCIIRRSNNLYAVRIDGNRLTAALILKDLPLLEKISPGSILYDKETGRFFFGTLNEGLFVITKKIFGTLTFKTADLIDNSFMALLFLDRGRILSHNGILDRNDGNQDRLFKGEERFDRNCLYRATDRSIWLSREKRLFKYDSSFSRKLMMDSTSLDSYVTGVIVDHLHTTWISTLYSLLKMKDGRLQYVLNRYPPFVNHTIESIAEVLPGKLWIATRDGLYTYDIATGRMDEHPVLPEVYVRSIFKAKDGSIWIGSYGNGFFKYQQGAFISLPLDPEKYLATAHAFLEDDHGFFWISTNHGLFKIWKKDLDNFTGADNKTLFYYYHDRPYGLNTNEFNGGCSPAALKDGEGYFYFPSLNGVVYFHPDSSQSELPDKAIFIDHFSVDSISLDYTQALKLKPDFNRIIVDIATPFYGAAENLRLEYKFNNIGEKWYPVNRDGRIIINRLPYDKYSLLIRKAGGWGQNNFTYSSISFEVLPRWYNTPWFYVLLIVAIIGAAWLLYKLRAGFLIRQNNRLQIRVNERTSELEQSIFIRERLISVIMHDLRSPLYSQDMLIGYLYEHLRDLPAADVKELLLQLRDSSKRICQFSTDFLTWYNSQQQGFLLERQPVELAACIKDASFFYREMAERQGLAFGYDVPPDLFLISDRNILTIVIRNLVDNAVKYTRSGGIRIIAFPKDMHLYIKVQDTGRGMSAAKIKELMSYPESGANNTTHSTFGYRFIIELTRQLEGVVHIESDSNTGTVVTLAFKV